MTTSPCQSVSNKRPSKLHRGVRQGDVISPKLFIAVFARTYYLETPQKAQCWQTPNRGLTIFRETQGFEGSLGCLNLHYKRLEVHKHRCVSTLKATRKWQSDVPRHLSYILSFWFLISKKVALHFLWDSRVLRTPKRWNMPISHVSIPNKLLSAIWINDMQCDRRVSFCARQKVMCDSAGKRFYEIKIRKPYLGSLCFPYVRTPCGMGVI